MTSPLPRSGPRIPSAAGMSERWGLLLLTLVASLSLWGQLQLFLRLRPGIPTAFLAVSTAFLLAKRISPRPLRDILSVCAIVALSAFAMGRIFDLSWDGQTYHQEAIFQLAHGWNPIWDSPLPVWHGDITWCNSYPKGIWLAQAVFFRVFGNLESAKAVAMSLFLSSLLLGFAAARSLDLKPGTSLLIAAAAALNPVVFCQLPSFYVDGALGSLLLILLALAVLFFQAPQRRHLVTMLLALSILCVTKFTGVVYAVFFSVGVGLSALLWKRKLVKPLLVTTVLGGVLGFLFLGFQPYVTNLRSHLHPFHPLAGSQRIDFMPAQLGPEFAAQPRILTLAESLFSTSTNDKAWPRWKIPFAVSRTELSEFGIPDIRIGGFGPWFGPVLGLSLLGVLFLFVYHSRQKSLPRSRRELGTSHGKFLWPGLLVLAVILASSLVNPGVFWARYVPQLWLIPVVVVVLLRLQGNRFAWPLLLLLSMNAALVIGGSTNGQLARQHAIRNQLDEIRRQPITVNLQTFGAVRFRLQREHVDFRLGTLVCPAPKTMVSSLVEYCLRTPEGTQP